MINVAMIPCWYCRRPMPPPGDRYCDECWAAIMKRYQDWRKGGTL